MKAKRAERSESSQALRPSGESSTASLGRAKRSIYQLRTWLLVAAHLRGRKDPKRRPGLNGPRSTDRRYQIVALSRHHQIKFWDSLGRCSGRAERQQTSYDTPPLGRERGWGLRRKCRALTSISWAVGVWLQRLLRKERPGRCARAELEACCWRIHR